MTIRFVYNDRRDGVVHAADHLAIGPADCDQRLILNVDECPLLAVNKSKVDEKVLDELWEPHATFQWEDDREKGHIMHKQNKCSLFANSEKVTAPGIRSAFSTQAFVGQGKFALQSRRQFEGKIQNHSQFLKRSATERKAQPQQG